MLSLNVHRTAPLSEAATRKENKSSAQESAIISHGKKDVVEGAETAERSICWDGASSTRAERREKIASADLKEQQLSEQRGTLVPRADVKLVFSRVYQILNSQVKTLAEKLGPDVAAALGLTEESVPRVQES